MAGGGVLQVTLLVTVVLCYLMTVTRGNGLLQHTGNNLILCNKTPSHNKAEKRFNNTNGP